MRKAVMVTIVFGLFVYCTILTGNATGEPNMKILQIQ